MSDLGKPELKVLIVGCGIAGLCAGIALAQQKHQVTIIESAHELAPIGVGLHIPPNATRVLKKLGLLEKMRQDAILPSTFVFRRWADSSEIVTFPAGQANHGIDLPYWSMKRSDYQRHLYEAAREAGCEIRLACRAESMDVDQPSITLGSGERISADLIVVADGVKSRLRDQVIPEADTSMVLAQMSSYRATVRKQDLLNDPITAPFFQEATTNVWMGYNHHLILYPIGGDLLSIGATCPAGNHEALSWRAEATRTDVQNEFAEFDPVVKQILSYADDVKQWRLAEVPRLPRWTSTSGKVVLVGDAAHGMLQYLAQGAAMATEDAAALAECLAQAKAKDEISQALKAFERARKWRCEIVQAGARRNGDHIHMPDGEEQEQRDLAMKGLPQTGFWQADPGPLRDQTLRTFIYDHDVFAHTHKVLAQM